MIAILLWIVSVILIGLSLWVILGNLWTTIGGLFKKRKSFESYVPLIGGVAGMVGMLFLPVPGMRRFWWVPLVVDLGCGPMLLAAAIDQVKKRFRH
jgi:hypothetical protein